MLEKLTNTPNRFGWVSIALHWLCALLVIGLFALGLYMVELTYYDSFYHDSFHWHESLGLVFLALLLVRAAWLLISPKPAALATTRRQAQLASWAHRLMYLLMLLIAISGYVLTSADGHGVAVFNWFELPSLTGKVNDLESNSGLFHYWASMMLIGLVVIHTIAALKHHFIDQDNTLRRMIKPTKDALLLESKKREQ